MVRINEDIVFNCETNSFIVDKFDNLESKFINMKIIWLLLFGLDFTLSIGLWFSLISFHLSTFSKLFLSSIVLLGVPFVAVLIYKMIGLIKNLHMGELIVFQRGLGTYHKEELAEKAEEDKFIYVFERKSQLKFKEDKKPSLPENEISYRQLIPLIQDKKRLVLRYSLFFNLVAVAGIVIIGFTPHTEYPASILPMFIPFFLYWLVLTTFGYSPIKSYRFWTKLEKHIEKFVIDKGSDKTDLPVINYEEIHRKVMEENKK